MIRPWMLAASVLAVLIAMAAPAQAQFNLRGMKFPAALQNVFMLRGDAVQTELALNEEQKTKITELNQQLTQEALEIFSGLQDLTPEEQKEQMPEVMKMIEDKGKEIGEKVDKIIDKKQQTRLRELSYQSRGAAALEDDEVIAALKITDDQKKKLADVREEGNKAMQDAIEGIRSGGGDQGEIREKMGKMRKELGDKGMAILTTEQREQFEKMKGVEFKFPQGGRGGFPF